MDRPFEKEYNNNMFEKKYKGESNVFPQSEESVRTALFGYYKNIDLCIEDMMNNPGEWRVWTPYAWYRYVGEKQ